MRKGWKTFWTVNSAIAGIGVLFLILAFLFGSSFSDMWIRFPDIFPFRDMGMKRDTVPAEHREFEKIHNLEIDVEHLSVCLKKSENPHVVVETKTVSPRANFEVSQEADTLLIETDLEGRNINNAGTVILYLPEDIQLYETDISIGAGSLSSELERISTKNLCLSVAAGRMEMRGVTAENTELECGMGAAVLEMRGAIEDYNYNIECGMGAVEIAGGSYSGIGVEQQINHGAAKNIDIECGMGNVEVNFGK